MTHPRSKILGLGERCKHVLFAFSVCAISFLPFAPAALTDRDAFAPAVNDDSISFIISEPIPPYPTTDGKFSTAPEIVTEPVCGDRVIISPEECDDGNLSNGDGCSEDCTVEKESLLSCTIRLSGGGALIVGLAEIIAEYTKMTVHIAPDPLTAVCRGTGIILENMEKFKDVLMANEDELPPKK